MSRPAVRLADLHDCSLHVAGPIIGPGAPTVLIEGGIASCLGDTVAGADGSFAHVVIGGTVGTVMLGRPATRLAEPTDNAGAVSSGATSVLIGKVLMVQVIIVSRSYWDNDAGRAMIAAQIQTAERVLGIRIIAGDYLVVEDPNLLDVTVAGALNNEDMYDQEVVDFMNLYGSSGQITLLYTDAMKSSSPFAAAVTVAPDFAGTYDGLINSGIVFTNEYGDLFLAHELGHVLVGTTSGPTVDSTGFHSTDVTSLMWPSPTDQNWTDPWLSEAEMSPLLR